MFALDAPAYSIAESARMPYLLGAALILLGAALRIVPHPPNFVPMGALAIYAASRLPRGWAFLVPVGAMALSDLAFGWAYGFAGFGLVQGAGYATFALVGLIAGRMPGREGVAARLGQAVGAATLFFLLSNLAVWAAPFLGGPAPLYPPTAAGLLACYSAGLVFYAYHLAAELLGVSALFGVEATARAALHPAEPARPDPAALFVRAGRRRG